LRPSKSGEVAYREEIYHPALAEPETASGFLSVTQSGDLVRDQRQPRREISEVGQSFLSVRDGPDAPENMWPIPGPARPMFAAMRQAVSGDAMALTRDFTLELVSDVPIWRVRLVPEDSELRGVGIVLIGCGATLVGMELSQPGGIRRILTFDVQK